jgi:chloramphenicol O-acetyltransferase type B
MKTSLRIFSNSRMIIVRILRSSLLNKAHEILHRNEKHESIIVGEYTYGVDNISVRYPNQAALRIGKFCSIANNVTIFLGGGHRHDTFTTYPFGSTDGFTKWDSGGFQFNGNPTTKGDVVIGNDVWIGSNVTIMSGVQIGDGVVIAANSHVVRNAAPYSIIGGNPAQLIKKRWPEELEKRIATLQWWDWPEAKIVRAQPILLATVSEDTLKLLQEVQDSNDDAREN